MYVVHTTGGPLRPPGIEVGYPTRSHASRAARDSVQAPPWPVAESDPPVHAVVYRVSASEGTIERLEEW